MPDLPVQILPAGEQDLAAIAALADVIWRAHYPGIISAAQIEFMLGWMYSLETLREELLKQGIRFVQLRVADAMAGFAAYGPTNDQSTFKLHKLYVHPGQQGCGLGSRLLSHCEQAAAELGAERLILAVNKRNHRAIRTYERNGYFVLESVVTDIGGGFVMDDFVMAKTLTGGQIKSCN